MFRCNIVATEQITTKKAYAHEEHATGDTRLNKWQDIRIDAIKEESITFVCTHSKTLEEQTHQRRRVEKEATMIYLEGDFSALLAGEPTGEEHTLSYVCEIQYPLC